MFIKNNQALELKIESDDIGYSTGDVIDSDSLGSIYNDSYQLEYPFEPIT